MKASTANSFCPRFRGRAVISLNPSAFSSWLAVLKLALCDDVMRHLPAIRSQIVFFAAINVLKHPRSATCSYCFPTAPDA